MAASTAAYRPAMSSSSSEGAGPSASSSSSMPVSGFAFCFSQAMRSSRRFWMASRSAMLRKKPPKRRMKASWASVRYSTDCTSSGGSSRRRAARSSAKRARASPSCPSSTTERLVTLWSLGAMVWIAFTLGALSGSSSSKPERRCV